MIVSNIVRAIQTLIFYYLNVTDKMRIRQGYFPPTQVSVTLTHSPLTWFKGLQVWFLAQIADFLFAHKEIQSWQYLSPLKSKC